MKLLALGFGALTLALAAPSSAANRCGSDPSDAAAVAAIKATASVVCDCCGSPSPARYGACLRRVAKQAVKTRQLRTSCVRRMIGDTMTICPHGGSGTGTACVTCQSDADCASGEFCECRAGTCNAGGGMCVAIPQVCPDIVLPVCGCDGTTFPNDCERRTKGACKAHDGACSTPPPPPTGGCFDTIENRCTGAACSDSQPCRLGNEFCTPQCAPPSGGCFDTIERRCTGKPCAADQPCGIPNEFCTPQCSVAECQGDADCNDGNPCTVDHCVSGTCQHACVCVAVGGATSCCPGPAALCVRPCGMSASGTCGGTCLGPNEVCTASGTTCACMSVTPACGDIFPTCNGTCPLGSTCQSMTGAPVCQCVPNGCGACASCGPGSFFYTCGDPVCGGPPPQNGVPACTTERAGDPCSCRGKPATPGMYATGSWSARPVTRPAAGSARSRTVCTRRTSRTSGRRTSSGCTTISSRSAWRRTSTTCQAPRLRPTSASLSMTSPRAR